MSENQESSQNPSLDEIITKNKKLEKDNAKIQKRLDRIVQQGDRQHKEFEQLNERLGSYVDVINDHVVSITTDKDKNLIDISRAFSNTFGFKSKEILGENYSILLNKDDLDRVNVELHDTVASGLPWHGEIRFINKSSTPIWTNTIITPNFDEGELIGFTFISEDISKEKELKELKTEKLATKKYDQSMLEFMSSKSSALLQRTSNSFSYVLWLVFATVVWLIVWANFAELEELTRGSGKIIPSQHVKKIDTLDNAKISEILVIEGNKVKKGDLLMRFNNVENSSSLEQNTLRIEELYAKAKRLELESKLIKTKIKNTSNSKIMQEEINLYKTNLEQLNFKIAAVREKYNQKKSDLNEAIKKENHLKNNYKLLKEELVIKETMAKEKIISTVEFLQFQRQKNDLDQELNKIKNEIIRAKSFIKELKANMDESKLEFQNRAKKEHHEVISELARLKQIHTSLNNQLSRREIISPVDGTIKKMYFTTIGEVAQAGNTLVEIIPEDDTLIAEVKIAPEDIAYLKLDQEAMMKFSAYDFNIFGGITAKISYISVDTYLDAQDGKNYFTIYLKLDKNYVGSEEQKLKIKVGMIADIDIIHGKKSVMDYILKPILKAKQNALTEK